MKAWLTALACYMAFCSTLGAMKLEQFQLPAPNDAEMREKPDIDKHSFYSILRQTPSLWAADPYMPARLMKRKPSYEHRWFSTQLTPQKVYSFYRQFLMRWNKKAPPQHKFKGATVLWRKPLRGDDKSDAASFYRIQARSQAATLNFTAFSKAPDAPTIVFIFLDK